MLKHCGLFPVGTDMMRRLLWLSCGLCLVFSAYARADNLSADDIARKMLRSDAFGWEGAKTRIRMALVEPDGKRKERHMEILGRRQDGLLQTVVRFLGPQDIAGTAFLMLEKQNGASEQYIYLSGLKRTRRIVGREQEGSFMGSDFSYADMQRIDAKYATNKRLADEDLSGTPVYVLEATLTKDAPSNYGKVTTWVRKSDYLALRTKFFDRQGALEKTLYTRRIDKLEGKPVVAEALMQNAKTKHSTELHLESIERNDALPDAAFTPTALEHW